MEQTLTLRAALCTKEGGYLRIAPFAWFADADHRPEQLAEARALAEIALRHLDGSCPVCGQSHEEEATRIRLEQMITAAGPREDDDDPADAISAIAEQLREAEAARIEATGLLGAAEAAERERELAAEDLKR